MAFKLTETGLRDLFAAANFKLPADGMLFVGLRGCTPVEDGGSDFATSHLLEHPGVDYTHMRCTLIQWKPGAGFAVFPGSTVPYRSAVQAGVGRGGAEVNQLALGFFWGDHRHYKGDHALNRPNSRHRAFRNDSHLPVWRTHDDLDYDGEDRLEYGQVYDNIHCAWQQNVAAPSFSSNGCQVIAGRPRVPSRGWNTELGPWARFVANAYGLSQSRFCYALFSGHEAMKVGEGAPRAQTVRFGSTGPLVETVQQALLHHGFDLGEAGADGDFGIATVRAVRLFQEQRFGAGAVDLIVGPNTGRELGIEWPALTGAAPPFSPATEPTDEGGGRTAIDAGDGPASAGDFGEAAATEGYRSLTKNGFFSANPFDLSVKRAIRTNNPGALNITGWQRASAGFAGETQPDSAGNVTAIYFTPEHGVGVWYHLLTHRYGYGETGVVTIGDLARRYAGVASQDHSAAKTYIAGWKRWSGGTLTATSQIRLADDDEVLALGKAMFGHEAGQASPLHDDQIVNAVKLKRAGKLPPR